MGMGDALAFVGLPLIAGLVSLYVSQNLVSHYVPQPYMDELFHAPQTARYCVGEWGDWDPKITTFPGLYLCHVAYAGVVEWFGLWQCDDLALMRSLNGVMYALLVLAVVLILRAEQREEKWSGERNSREKHKSYGDRLGNGISSVIVLKTIRIAAFPLLFFFSTLFYTDVGSTLFVLWAYLFSKQRRVALAAAFCAVAVLFRQTNIIWTVWIAAQCVLNDFDRECKTLERQERSSLMVNIIEFMTYALRNFGAIVLRYWSFLLMGMGFAIFVFVNGGIVIGDRENHNVTWNIPQMFFFSVFSCIFAPGVLISTMTPGRIIDTVRRHVMGSARWMIGTLTLSALVGYVAYHFCYVHIFLLSDNRHFTFYLWRKIFKIHEPQRTRLFHALYSPVYLMAMTISVFLLRNSGRSRIWVTLLAICTALTIVPAPLVEFRYFMIPFILMQLNVKSGSMTAEVVNLVMYIAINVITIHLFLFRTFPYGSPGTIDETGRFMW